MAAWGFNENIGSTAADATGAGHTGTLVGPVWTTQGRFGAALSFDGSNDYVSVLDASDLDMTSALTLEAWVNPTNVAGYDTILAKTTTGSPSNYYLAVDGDEVAFGFIAGTWREHTTVGVNLVAGTWVHLAAVYSDSANIVRLYVDGVERLAETETNSLVTNADGLRIGVGYANEPFGGRIDEVRVYDRALSAAEIAADQNTAVGAAPSSTSTTSSSTSTTSTSTLTSTTFPTGLVAAFAFEEGSGATVFDASGVGNDGTITGAIRTTNGRNGSAIFFDGSGDFITVDDADSLDLTAAVTLEAWVYPTVDNNAARPIVGKERAGQVAYFLNAATAGADQPSARIYNGASLIASGGTRLPVNQWTHLAATFDGDRLRLYRNGVLAADQGASGTLATSTRALRIGNNQIEGGVFTGRIDDVRVYSRALTVGEIAADMGRPVP